MFYDSKDINNFEDLGQESQERYILGTNQLLNSKKIVIKFGTESAKNVLYESKNPLIKHTLADDIAKLCYEGKKIIIVSSGAIGLGRKVTELHGDDETILRASYATLGQPRLINLWNNLLSEYKSRA